MPGIGQAVSVTGAGPDGFIVGIDDGEETGQPLPIGLAQQNSQGQAKARYYRDDRRYSPLDDAKLRN